MEPCANGVEWVKINTSMWFGHIWRKNSEEFVKTVYVSEIEGPGSRGRLVVRWKDKVEKYMHERVADRERRVE